MLISKANRNAWVMTALILVAGAAGCGYSGGEALFMSGLVKNPIIEAEFEFTDQPVAIIVDDFQEHVYWPEATAVLAKHVAEELKRVKAAQRIVAARRATRLRQANPDFDERSTREIGELLGADQVVAIEVRSFQATVDPAQAHSAALMSVAVKVINVLEKEHRSKVRLWPKSPDGKLVRADLSAADVMRAKDRKGIVEALTKSLAEEIAKNFYERRAEDFEEP